MCPKKDSSPLFLEMKWGGQYYILLVVQVEERLGVARCNEGTNTSEEIPDSIILQQAYRKLHPQQHEPS